MACSSCSTGSKASDPKPWIGSWLGGAKHTFLFEKKSAKLIGIRTPNILIFEKDPYIANTENIVLEGVETIDGVTGLLECATATGGAVLVANGWEVTTNLNIVSRRGAFIDLAVASVVNYGGFGCPPSATTTAPVGVTAHFCDGTVNPANFTGVVYTRKPSGNNVAFDVYIVSNSNNITFKRQAGVKVGDSVTISGTALDESNPGTVIKIAVGTAKDGAKMVIATLDKPVTNVVAQPGTDGQICVAAIATPQVIGNLTFTQECKCAIIASFSPEITNDASFPVGMPYEDGRCDQSMYYYMIHNYTVGAKVPDICGSLIL